MHTLIYTSNKTKEGSTPVSLQIGDVTYEYPGKHFEKLLPFVGEKIKVNYQREGKYHHNYEYTLTSIDNVNGVDRLNLDR